MRDLLKDELVEILLNPGEWRIVSSLFPPDVDCMAASDHTPLLHEAASHCHSYRQVMITLCGTATCSLSDRCFPCTPGTVTLCDADEMHQYEPDHGASHDYLRINVLRNQLMARLWLYRDGELANPDERSLLIASAEEEGALYKEWSDLHQRGARISPAMAKMKLVSALARAIVSILEQAVTPALQGTDAFRREVVDMVRQHIDRTDGRGANVADLARLSGYSMFHFAKLFKEYTGQSIHEYRDGCRVAKARAMLRDGCSQKQVCRALGFSSQPSFSHWLKRHGLTGQPRQPGTPDQ